VRCVARRAAAARARVCVYVRVKHILTPCTITHLSSCILPMCVILYKANNPLYLFQCGTNTHSHFKLFQATNFNYISLWISLRKLLRSIYENLSPHNKEQFPIIKIRNYYQEHINTYAPKLHFLTIPHKSIQKCNQVSHHDLFFRVGTLPGLNPP
jgi:hypothetical protein